jgi:hypothetical protein
VASLGHHHAHDLTRTPKKRPPTEALMGHRTLLEAESPRQARRGETWNDHWQRRLRESQRRDAALGDRTKPAQPQGTSPLERDDRRTNQSR